ncbi:MAG TPA: hypothetical protein VGH22_02555 [Candidatus Binatia bacterium]|jgi:hypothetical protein
MQAITRRHFLKTTIGFACLSAAPVCTALAEDSRFQGCFLRPESVNILETIKLFPSFNDNDANQVCATAEQELRRGVFAPR